MVDLRYRIPDSRINELRVGGAELPGDFHQMLYERQTVLLPTPVSPSKLYRGGSASNFIRAGGK